MKKTYNGSCHCGKVRFLQQEGPDKPWKMAKVPLPEVGTESR